MWVYPETEVSDFFIIKPFFSGHFSTDIFVFPFFAVEFQSYTTKYEATAETNRYEMVPLNPLATANTPLALQARGIARLISIQSSHDGFIPRQSHLAVCSGGRALHNTPANATGASTREPRAPVTPPSSITKPNRQERALMSEVKPTGVVEHILYLIHLFHILSTV